MRASKHGRFHVRFTVLACPAKPLGAEARSAVCYLGEPAGVGVDAVRLIGATAIAVRGS